MKTLSEIMEGIIHGIKNYYSTIETNGSGDESKEGINEQGRIGWNHFCRWWISETLTNAMSKYYSSKKQKTTFTGIGWSKKIIGLMIDIHVEEWYLCCNIFTNGEKIEVDEKMFSLRKKSFLITIKYFHSKIESLSVNKRNLF